jgi:hypothetical protein
MANLFKIVKEPNAQDIKDLIAERATRTDKIIDQWRKLKLDAVSSFPLYLCYIGYYPYISHPCIQSISK